MVQVTPIFVKKGESTDAPSSKGTLDWFREHPLVKWLSFVFIVFVTGFGTAAFLYQQFVVPGRDNRIEQLKEELAQLEKRGPSPTPGSTSNKKVQANVEEVWVQSGNQAFVILSSEITIENFGSSAKGANLRFRVFDESVPWTGARKGKELSFEVRGNRYVARLIDSSTTGAKVWIAQYAPPTPVPP